MATRVSDLPILSSNLASNPPANLPSPLPALPNAAAPAMSAALWQALGDAQALHDGGLGLRFDVQRGEQRLPAFALRFAGQPVAYLNQCAHVAMEMDWQLGQFFDAQTRYIMCATHGALYEPSSGRCIDGPCKGAHLVPVPLKIEQGQLYAAQSL